ncbi:MAG: DUF3108 domain-containing protein [Bacteroidales bacterium]
MKFSISVFFLLIISNTGISQAPSNTAFQAGETLKLKGSYYMSSLWADLAEIKIEVADYNADGKQLYSIKATANTYSNYDSFFKIRDLYQTWVDKNTVLPFIFKRNVDEGGYKFNMKYTIKRSALQAKYEYERNTEKKSTIIKITPNTHDLISILYYIRTLDFENMPLKKTTVVSVLVDDKTNNISLTYKGKEAIKTETMGTKTCYKIGISINNKALVNKETNNFWLTADKNKVPVLFKAEIPVGSIQMRLVEAKGLKQ